MLDFLDELVDIFIVAFSSVLFMITAVIGAAAACALVGSAVYFSLKAIL